MGGYANPCYDPECPLEGRHEAHAREPAPWAGLVIIVRKALLTPREILVTTNRRYGQYALPGGKLDEGDPTPRFTAIRELREETGLVVLDSDLSFLLQAVNTVNGSDRDIHVFFARAAWGQPKNLEEGTEFAWFTYEKLLESSVFAPFYKKHLPDGIDHLMPTLMTGS